MTRLKARILVRRGRRRASRLLRRIAARPAFRVGVVIGCLALASSWALHLVERTPPRGVPAHAWPYTTYSGAVEQVGILLFSGYDAEKPQHPAGFALTMFCTFLGIALLALITADLASVLVAAALAGAKRRPIRAVGHIVICGWHYTTRVLIEQLTDREAHLHREIVVVDEGIGVVPIHDPDVHFIEGDPTEIDALRLAGSPDAHTIIVPIDWKLPESLQDSRTTLTVMAIKSASEQAYVCAEVLKNRNRRHIERTGVEEVVCVGELSQKLLSQAALTHGLSRLMEGLLTFSHESEIYKVKMPPQLAGLSFRGLLRRLNKQRQAILLAVHRAGSLHTNPQSEFALAEGDELFILSANPPRRLAELADPAA